MPLMLACCCAKEAWSMAWPSAMGRLVATARPGHGPAAGIAAALDAGLLLRHGGLDKGVALGQVAPVERADTMGQRGSTAGQVRRTQVGIVAAPDARLVL